MDLSKIPSWIFSVSIGVLVIFIVTLSITDKHFCYKNRIGFVKKSEQCVAGKNNTPIILEVEKTQQNISEHSLFVTGYCQPTGERKDLEGYIGPTKNIEDLDVITSSSGADRIQISFVVPPNWHFQIKRKAVKGIGCYFKGLHL